MPCWGRAARRGESRVPACRLPGQRLLKERLGARRICFTDAERRRLARKAFVLGRKALNGLDTLVTPDTLLRWH